VQSTKNLKKKATRKGGRGGEGGTLEKGQTDRLGGEKKTVNDEFDWGEKKNLFQN